MALPAPKRPIAELLAELAAKAPSVAALAGRGEPRHYRKGMLLIQEGDQGDTLYIVLQGRLRAFAVGDNGREITYGTYGAGEFIGEMSLDGGPRSASVETLEWTVCAVVTRTTLEQHLAAEPAFAFELLSKVIRRARAATLSAKQLALNDVYGRLKLLLEGSAVPQPDGSLWIAERLTHQQMAYYLGSSREMVSRLMKDLQDGGHVTVEGKGLRLKGRLPMRW